MNVDVVLLVLAVAGLALTFVTILYVVGYFRDQSEANEQQEDHADDVERPGRARRRGLDGLRQRRHRQQNQAEMNQEGVQNDGDNLDDEEDDLGDVDQAARTATTKKEMQKELKRQEREAMRKFEESRREELQRQREAKEKAYKAKLDEQELEEAEKERALEELQRAQQEQAQQEFDKWKSMFSIDEAGSSTLEDDENPARLQDFINYIQSAKVVVMEDVAMEFGLQTKEAIARVESLVQDGRLSGLLDDRGKFISITDSQMDRLAVYLRKRGRVNLSDFARECNHVLSLS
ncbi:hypothetical protein LEN26_000416 [Aphanomyces euteiches]|nr:hypothetical protein AeMF1_015782 [Aphanomyces euteiches]KAH9163677.1 hypothetical protein LEN26_000416 [Aphanomyces euteiches]KAH9190192.1 hypothetical protein AeNC1_007837 [Aphanomyces euteiches]